MTDSTMGLPRYDHELRIYVDAETYLVLSRLADADDRTLSGYCRALLRAHALNSPPPRAGVTRPAERTDREGID